MRTLQGQPCEMKCDIRAVRKQAEKQIFSFHCAYSPYALNELTLPLTQKILAQHEKYLMSFLSILDRIQ